MFSCRSVSLIAPSCCRSISAVPQLPVCNFQPEPFDASTYDRHLKIRQTNLSPGLIAYYKKPLLVHQGHMQWLFDHQGKRYLDMFAGIVTVSVGHCHPKTTAALEGQSKKLWHTTCIYMHPQIQEYAAKLVAKLPDKLKVVYFVNSGSEANDMALLMSRLYTGNFDVISLRNAYHGASPYTMGLTSLSNWRYKLPAGFGIHQTMNPDVYRGPWGGSHCRDSPVQTDRSCDCSPGTCSACGNYVEQLHDVIRHSTPKKGIAAFIAEGIQGVGGSVQFPRGYLQKAFELVRQAGGLCISDEVQTGFGRLGSHYWGFESHDVVPDIVTMAKGMGNGMPLAAVVTTPEVAATMGTALHFNTYGGNPLSCAVGSAVMDVIEEDGLQANSQSVGTYLLERLAELKANSKYVGDVRGKGLMIGVEMVSDKKTREPMPIERVNKIWEDAKDMGLLLGKGGLYGCVFRLKPPMCVTREDVDFTVEVLRKAIEHN